MVYDQASVSVTEQQKSLEYLDAKAKELRSQLLEIDERREEAICQLRLDIMLLFENSNPKRSLHIGKHDLPMESPDGLLDLAMHLNILAELQKYINSYKFAVFKTVRGFNSAVECSISIS